MPVPYCGYRLWGTNFAELRIRTPAETGRIASWNVRFEKSVGQSPASREDHGGKHGPAGTPGNGVIRGAF